MAKPYHERCGTRHNSNEPCPMDDSPSPARKPKGKSERAVHKSHAWGGWGAWNCTGDLNGMDVRYRHCMDATCDGTEEDKRRCRHGKRPQS
jgi:hypothetical protein